MIPKDYRLEQVCARLTEGLEGARRSFAGDPERAARAFERLATDHVQAAIIEMREIAMLDHPDQQAAFLERELIQTFLPRYQRLAVEMTEHEEGGHGLGMLAEPLGRVGLVGISLLCLFVLLRFIWLPYMWPLILLALSVPFWPDIVAVAQRNRYRRSLESLLADMQSLQDLENTYLGAAQLRPEAPRTTTEAPKKGAEPTLEKP